MSKKLYIYTICLAIAYVVLLGHSVYEMGTVGVAGFKFGYTEGSSGRAEYHVFGGNIVPIAGSATFPTSFINEKTGETGRLEIRQILAFFTQSPANIPGYIKVIESSKILWSFLLIGLFIYLPFVVYRILKSVAKGGFYSLKNIRNIRKASFILLAIFLTELLVNITNVITSNFYMQLKDYTAYLGEVNYTLLMMGLVVLILSEILCYTMKMQEEQELTV